MLLSVRWICEDLDISCAESEITFVGRTGCQSVHNSTDNVFVDQMKFLSGRVLVSVCQLVGFLYFCDGLVAVPRTSVDSK